MALCSRARADMVAKMDVSCFLSLDCMDPLNFSMNNDSLPPGLGNAKNNQTGEIFCSNFGYPKGKR
jgi:hypothetical protein